MASGEIHDKVHLRADEIDGARKCRQCHQLHWEVIDSGMSHSARIVGTCSRPAASGKRARTDSKFLIYLVCALNKSYMPSHLSPRRLGKAFRKHAYVNERELRVQEASNRI